MDEAGITTADQADASGGGCRTSGIGRIDRLIGASYGAMVGLAFAERHGQRLQPADCNQRRASLSTAAPRCVRFSAILLPWGCEYRPACIAAVAVARTLAMTTYRPAALFDRRFAGRDTRTDSAEPV
jgi:homoserine O-acetyltransferase/O-succinyltransferase